MTACCGELQVTINTSHLRKEYSIADMSYLDGEKAMPIYKAQAEFIRKHDLRGIIDVGCRLGSINRWLYDHDYRYLGFDTSVDPIEQASQDYPGKTFVVADWDDPPQSDFDVDVVLFSSVLIYDSDPHGLFERLCEFYQPKWAIVHEINHRNQEDFNYTDLKYWSNKYPTTIQEMSLDIPCGERTIIYAQYK